MSDFLEQFRNRQEARAGSYISRGAATFPLVGDRLIACDHPAALRIGYSLARNLAETVPADRWSKFEGDARAGRWPSSYRKVGVVLGSVAVLDEIRERETSLSLAVGWVHKGSVLVGVLPENVDLTGSEGRYEVGMRVGRGTLQTALGVYNPLGREFFVPPHASATGAEYQEVLDAPRDLVIL